MAEVMQQKSTSVRRISRSRGDGRISARATVLNVERAEHSTSRQTLFEDEFSSLAAIQGMIVATPYNVPQLFELIERSNMLSQCIDAMVTNTVGTGWEVGQINRKIEIDEDEKDEVESFADRANSEESLSTVMGAITRDVEAVGFGFMEVIRDRAGNVTLLRHSPALNTRLGHKHPQEQLIKYDIMRGKRRSTVVEFKRFRRFAQIVSGIVTWFKEYGDPRPLNARTGLFQGEEGYTDDCPATEMIHWKLPSNDPYGVPRWISQVPSVRGSREVEEVNLRYFEDNTVPPMMVTVAGGRLTAASFKELQKVLNTDIGRERQNKIILLEAVGESDSLDGKASTIQLKVEKLTDTRQSDGLFKDYDESNQSKIRSSFRISPIVVGMSADHNFATANVAMFAAESQVFAPYRNGIDEKLNNLLINGRPGLRMKTCKLVSRTPSITSPDMVIKTMTALNVMGALTPRIAQKMSNKILQIEIDQYPEKGKPGYEAWMDQPIIFVTKGTESEDGQALKDDKTKKLEDDGDVTQQQPKHGSE